VRKPDGKSPLGRSWCAWEDNIRMDLKRIGFGGVDWINTSKKNDRRRAVVNTVLNHRLPQNAGKFLTR
jgi:hypothetical protein